MDNIELPFPECYENCKVVLFFGVCECEAFCPTKFDNKGNPVIIKGDNNEETL